MSCVMLFALASSAQAGILATSDPNDLDLTPEGFGPLNKTYAHFESFSGNVTLVTAVGVGHPATGAHWYGSWTSLLDGHEYALNGDENFDVIFSSLQNAFAMEYVDDAIVSTFTLTFYNAGSQVGQTQFTTTAFDTAQFIGFISDDSFDRIAIREEDGPSNYNEYFQFYTAQPSNQSPTAVGGADRAIRAGDPVHLDGSASFDDNTASEALDYLWSFTSKPEASSATLVGADTATPSFVADATGSYVVELVVTDEGGLASDADQVEISSDNMAPTAAAGDDRLVVVGSSLWLDGSGSSDPEADALTYDWAIASAPEGSSAAISTPDMQTAGLTPDVEGVYQVTLTVSDFLGAGTPDTVEITATSAAGYAEFLILAAHEIAAELAPDQVTTRGNQEAFQRHLINAIKELQKGKLDKAVRDLEKLIERTDGCVLRGSPDGKGKGRDHITDCGAQTDLHGLLEDALNALQAP